jgi:hypothetical protein
LLVVGYFPTPESSLGPGTVLSADHYQDRDSADHHDLCCFHLIHLVEFVLDHPVVGEEVNSVVEQLVEVLAFHFAVEDFGLL